MSLVVTQNQLDSNHKLINHRDDIEINKIEN